MSDKIHDLTARFVKELREAIAHEILKSLEGIVVGVTTPKAVPKVKTKKKKDKAALEYQRHWRIARKIKTGKTVSPEDTKWHSEYLKRKK